METATVHDWPADGSQGREFSVVDALKYLDKIKVSFADTPEVYGEFLTIMKNFKSQQIDTQEVVGQIKALFSGKKDLISDFYQFLPDDVSEEAFEGMKSTSKNAPANEQRNVVSPSAPARLQQAHAMTYVIKVRNRFVNQPHIYSSFLQVLNSYHMSQRTIKEVLEVVSQLFADHIDLLNEFAYFLPDAVQEQAKERMQEAVREAERRRQQMPAPAPAPSALQPPYLTGVLPMISAPVPTVPETGMFVPTLPEHLLLQSPTSSAMYTMPAGVCPPLPTPSHLLAATAPSVALSVAPTTAASSAATAVPVTVQAPPAPMEAPAASADSTVGTAGTVDKRRDAGGRKRANSSAKRDSVTNKRTANSVSDDSSVSLSVAAPSVPVGGPAMPQTSSAADMERRLGTVEALVQLQQQRLDEQAAQIAQLKAVRGRKRK